MKIRVSRTSFTSDEDECDIFDVVNKYKSVILSKSENGYELEIYDDYRE